MAVAEKHDTTTAHGTRRARTTGLAIAGASIVVFNPSPLLDWVDAESKTSGSGNEMSRTGYETDSLVPFIAYLGIGSSPSSMRRSAPDAGSTAV